MALSRIRIIVNENFTVGDSLSFDLYNTNTLSTTTYTYTCVDTVRDINEFLETDTSPSGEDDVVSSLIDAIFQDYGNTFWTIQNPELNILELTTVSEDTVFQNGTSALDVEFEYSSIPVPQAKKSYFFEFTDLKGIEHRVDIDFNEDNSDKQEIKGNYSIENANNDDILTPLRPKQATINLDADIDLTFFDLYTEEERVYKVTIVRDNVTIFVGWLSPEGLYENYVSDKWQITLNAIDGLGYLEDIKYISDDGILYSGKQTDIEKLSIALGKTNLGLGFRTSINIFYEGLSGVDILANTYFNAERYYTEDNNEPFNCKEILESVLQKYNATITQEDGVWYIYRVNEIYDNANITFYNYDADGTANGTYVKDLSFTLGSAIDNYYPHHSNENQQKSIRRSLGVYRSNLKFGRVFPYFQNTTLNWTDASNISDWTIVQPTLISPCDNLQGMKVIDGGSIVIVANTDNYTVDGIPRVQFQTTFSNLNNTKPLANLGSATFNAKVIYVKGANTYYLTKDGLWTMTDSLIQHSIGVGEKNFTLTVVAQNNLPEADGDIRIDLYDAGSGSAIFPICIHQMSLQTYIGQDAPQGSFYTIEKLNRATPNTTDVDKIIHGDVPDNTYYSAIYENDETTNTEFWYRKNYNESKPLLRIMAEDKMRMNYLPKILFEGDIYGYVPFLSRVNVVNVKDKMMALEWGYDAYDNITRVKLIELLNYNFLDIDVVFSITDDYGETVKPTIQS